MTADKERLRIGKPCVLERPARGGKAIGTGERHEDGQTAFIDGVADEPAFHRADGIRQRVPPSIEPRGK